jgi:hypothetical protein
LPPEHDCAFPQDVPAALLPLATQTEEPVAHDVDPVLQTSVGWQIPPAVHATQLPSRHTELLPHAVPLGRFALLSLQIGDPVAQLSVPVRHGFDGVHEAPSEHAPQTPFEQTWFVPHDVPFG